MDKKKKNPKKLDMKQTNKRIFSYCCGGVENTAT